MTKVEYFDGTQTLVLGQYYYDGDGKRIKKVEASQTTIYIYLGWNIIYEKEMSTNTITDHVFGPNGHVAKVKGGTKYYYHSDHLGSLKQETDADGNTVWSSPAQYEPFGELRSGGGQNEDGYFYTGKLRDSSTGLYYYGNRYYDTKLGRFLTKHCLSGSASNSQTWNPYSYVLNNPLRYIDPTGNEEDDLIEPGVSYTKTRSGRITHVLGAGGPKDVSGEGLYDTEMGIIRAQTANTGTNASQTVAPPPPAPVATTPTLTAREKAYLNREEKYGSGVVDVVNTPTGLVSREQAYANKEARMEVAALVEGGMNYKKAIEVIAAAEIALGWNSIVFGFWYLIEALSIFALAAGYTSAQVGAFAAVNFLVIMGGATLIIGLGLLIGGSALIYFGGQHMGWWS